MKKIMAKSVSNLIKSPNISETSCEVSIDGTISFIEKGMYKS